MPRPFPSLQPPGTTARALRRWLTGTFAGRSLTVGILLKLASLILHPVPGADSAASALGTIGGLALVVAAVALAYRLHGEVKSVLLWRVRRKLTVSYIFIGFVPALLIIVLFSTAGLMLFYNVSQYVGLLAVESAVDQAAFLAESTAFGLEGAETVDEIRVRLARRQGAAQRSYPFVSYAVVPARRACANGGPARAQADITEVITAGEWGHLSAPRTIPPWLECDGFKALTAYSEVMPGSAQPGAEPAESAIHLVARAVAWPDERDPKFAVVVDVPFSTSLLERFHRQTGIDIRNVTIAQSENAACTAPLPEGRAIEPLRAVPRTPASSNPFRRAFRWVMVPGFREWTTGSTCFATVSIYMTIADLYNRIVPEFRLVGVGGKELYDVVLVTVAVLAVLLLVIQMAAFIMGLSLARSITGAIHELFTGTERVRHGDFMHKIPIRSRDQLGALAESFNSMTSSIEDLLEQKADKERMEQELRIARNIQMSLLPTGGLSVPGLSVTAHCEPAREVGGDYYDYLPIDDHRVGLLIADVAGKGTSAALYMAELKGLMLSLSQHHTSPRRLLIDANRIISRHLDTRSFITITYAVVDRDAMTLTFARAGHCPLIYVPGPYAASRRAQVLTPDGLVLGLQIDDGQRFEKLLVESTVPLGAGDLFLFYTDGLTDAMDPDGNCFGDQRLAALAQEHADLPFEELRERILREIEAFSASSARQDDMTILLLKVEDVGTRRGRAAPSEEARAETVGAGAHRI